jgi:hypothetical protein
MNDTPAGSRSLPYDSVADVTVENERRTLQDSVSDMLALERHIKQPAARQLQFDGASISVDAARAIARLDMMTDVHIRALEDQLHQLGGSANSPVKSAAATVLGVGAAAIEGVRKMKISKSLRDDYAALSLAAISYTMLHATALGFGDGSTAGLAKRHRDDIAALIVEICRIMPGAVLQELLDAGLDISPERRQNALRDTHEGWRTTP